MHKFMKPLIMVLNPSEGAWVMQIIGVALAAIYSFLLPVQGFLYLIGAFVLADLYTGWRKTRKLQGQKFNSRGLGKTLEKTLMYLVLMLVSRGIDNQYGLEDEFSLAYIVGGLIIGREGLSIFENVDAVLGTAFAPAIKELWQRVSKKNKP